MPIDPPKSKSPSISLPSEHSDGPIRTPSQPAGVGEADASGNAYLNEFEDNAAKWRAKKAGKLNPLPPPSPIPPQAPPAGTAFIESSRSAADSDGTDLTPPQPGGTGKPDASRQSGEKPVSPADKPPVSTKIVEKSQQGVTTDAKSASVVDLAAGSVPSPSEYDGDNESPDGVAKTPKRRNAITIRLTDDEYARIAKAAGIEWTPGDKGRKGKKIGDTSMASVILDAALNAPPDPVPEINRLVWTDLAVLMATLGVLTEQLNAGNLTEDLRPILREIMHLMVDLRKDLLSARAPDATINAIHELKKEVAFIKDNTFYYHNPRRKVVP